MFIKLFMTLSIILPFTVFCQPSEKKTTEEKISDDIYLGVLKEDYLLGKFERTKLDKFINKNEKDVHHLRPDTIAALNRMIEAYDLDRIQNNKNAQHIFIKSAFRSFYDQKSIWEDKFTGKRKMREDVTGKTPEQIIELILEYSSAPGTSRHHWGTDMDLNALQNDYFDPKGKGGYLYEWLQKNADKFGFCQPYNELEKRGNKGYKEERWHWSFAPIANHLKSDWEKLFNDKKISFEKGKFLGSEILKNRPLLYVTSINESCKKAEEEFKKNK